MELLLWRHADAEPGADDLARELTPKGRKQAARMGEWLDQALPSTCRILVSPAVRALQTAEALGRKFKIVDELAPERSVRNLLDAANWPDSREPVLIVGHQPTLGRAAAMLIGGHEQEWTLRKANVCWIAQRLREEGASGFIRCVMSPELTGLK